MVVERTSYGPAFAGPLSAGHFYVRPHHRSVPSPPSRLPALLCDYCFGSRSELTYFSHASAWL
jgi:hypothetical protein